MYMDIDRWRALTKIMKHSSPKEFGIYVVNQKRRLRGGCKRK